MGGIVVAVGGEGVSDGGMGVWVDMGVVELMTVDVNVIVGVFDVPLVGDGENVVTVVCVAVCCLSDSGLMNWPIPAVI